MWWSHTTNLSCIFLSLNEDFGQTDSFKGMEGWFIFIKISFHSCKINVNSCSHHCHIFIWTYLKILAESLSKNDKKDAEMIQGEI